MAPGARNGRYETPRPGDGTLPPAGGISGRRALGLVVLLMTLFGALVTAIIISREWRQSERLIAAGLRNPRGIALTPDDGLVVAEAGLPDTAGARSAVSGRLTWAAGDSRGTLIGELPSQVVGDRGEVVGPAAIGAAPDGRTLILMGGCAAPLCDALLAGGGDGRLVKVADLRDAVPDGPPRSGPYGGSNPWGMAIAHDGTVYVSDAAAHALLRVDVNRTPARVDLLARLSDGATPTGMALGPDGALYVALFGTVPHAPGAGSIARVAPDGAVTTAVDGLTMPIGVGFEPDGTIMALELAASYDAAKGYVADSGRLLRVDPKTPAERTVVSSHLDHPTALLVAPDGRVYVSVHGAFNRGPAPTGELIQIRRLGPQPTPRVI